MFEYTDVIPNWTDELSFPSASVWTPAPRGDTAAPNDSLANNLWNGLKSIGSAAMDTIQKSSDIFADTLNNVAQAKSAWETIFRPSSEKPSDPQANSQLPSLQPIGNTSGQIINWAKLRNALSQLYRGKEANNVSAPTQSTSIFPTVAIIGIFIAAIFFLMRGSKHA